MAGAGTSGDQLIDLLAAGFRLFGNMLTLFAGAVQWVIVVLAAASMLCIALAVVLFFTARGLHAGRHWARILGIAAASVYVIWTLGFRFN